MGTAAMAPAPGFPRDAYRECGAAELARLPRPKRPKFSFFMDVNDIDLGADTFLSARFEAAGACVEETWLNGAMASCDGVVLAAAVLGFADDIIIGTKNPRTRGLLRASIPRSLGAAVIVPRRHAGVLGWAARHRLIAEHVLDDVSARDAFFVRGDDTSIRSLLTPDVCAAIASMGGTFWSLVIGGGIVELSWRAPRFDAEVVLPDAAVPLVVTMARASVGLPSTMT
jgi:hypothetical protein